MEVADLDARTENGPDEDDAAPETAAGPPAPTRLPFDPDDLLEMVDRIVAERERETVDRIQDLVRRRYDLD